MSSESLVGAAGKLRDGTHTALGGKNASALKYKLATAQGTGKVEAKAPDGYIVTGGGWDYPRLASNEGVISNRPSSDCKGWAVEIHEFDLQHPGVPVKGAGPFTVYAVCVRDDG